MISREAISYDLHETRAALASGHADEAHRQLDHIIEDLKFLLSQPGRGRRLSLGTSAEDDVGRNYVETLFTLCDQARAALTRGENPLALTVLIDAKRFWDALPDNRKAHRLAELLQQVQVARLHASAGEPERATAVISETRTAIGAMLFESEGVDKRMLRPVRAHLSVAGLAIVRRDFSRSVLALDSAIRTLGGEGGEHK